MMNSYAKVAVSSKQLFKYNILLKFKNSKLIIILPLVKCAGLLPFHIETRSSNGRPPPPSFSATPRGRGNNSQNPNEFPFPLGWIFTRAFHFWPSLWLIYQIDSHPLLYSQMLLLLFHRRNTQFPLPRRYFYCIPIPPPSLHHHHPLHTAPGKV